MKVFISYSKEDQRFADEVMETLDTHGISVFNAFRDIQAGESFPNIIQKAIHEADAVIVLVSRASSKSRWIQSELAFAISQRELPGSKLIIPIIVEPNVDIPFFLRDIQWLDGVNPKTRHKNILKLIEVLNKSEPIDSPVERRMAEKKRILAERETLEADKLQLEALKQNKSKQIFFRSTIIAVFSSTLALLTAVLAFTKVPLERFDWLFAFIVGALVTAFSAYFYYQYHIKKRYELEIERLAKYNAELAKVLSETGYKKRREGLQND